ncbi:hypothetical protein [Roseovarius sp.]|uniref:hypothetical protein n=1 Tax=Roseovarius sp. TaxID=1486281 RepID=UPI002604335C|nr:hypothetical protein [Roseovarius sp.]MDM8168390.1 hypothetical protein [Roseovarius sp.]
MHRLCPALAIAGLLPAAAPAQTLLSGDHSISGGVCIGPSCAADEPITSILKLKGNSVRLFFEDISTSAGFPTNDWVLEANASSGTGDYFALRDADTFHAIMRLNAGAPPNSLYVSSDGDVGLGTSLPLANLHVVDTAGTASLRLEGTTGTPYSWDLRGNQGGFYVYDIGAGTLPLRINSGAPSSSFAIGSDGNVGLGTNSPDAPLEVSDAGTFSFFRITAESAPVNQSVDITFTQGPLTTGEIRYNIVDGDGPEMRLNADGDMAIDGTLTTSGSCSVGCDAVFDAGYPLPSIEEHHAQTLALGHLPNVGPTRDGEPWDVTDKMGRILNELEHAHLFIARQQQQITRQQAELAETRAALAALTARLDRIDDTDHTGQP